MEKGRHKGPVSFVWKYFQRMAPKTDSDRVKVQCNMCSCVLLYQNTTSTMLRHLKKKHQQEIPQFIEKKVSTEIVLPPTTKMEVESSPLFLVVSQCDETGTAEIEEIELARSCMPVAKTVETEPQSINTRQIAMSSSCISAPYSSGSHEEQKLDKALAYMISKDLHPFSIVEGAGFKQFINDINPRYQLPTKETIKRVMEKEYTVLQTKLEEHLQHIDHVAITLESWISVNNENVFAVLCHYLDDYNINIGLLDIFRTIQITPDYLVDVLGELFKRWNLEKKVVCISTNDQPNIVAAVNSLQMMHTTCYVETLSSIVKTAIEETSAVKSVVERFNKIVSYFKQSPDDLKKMQDCFSIPRKSLIQEVPTQHFSTYIMMQRMVELKGPLCLSLTQLPELPIIIDADWRLAENALKVLTPFVEAVKEIVAEKSVSIAKVVPMTKILDKLTLHYANVFQDVDSLPENNSASILSLTLNKEIKRKMGDVESHRLYGLAALLDPRFKKLAFENPDKLKSAIQELKADAQRYVKLESGKNSNGSSVIHQNVSNATWQIKELKTDLWTEFDDEVQAQCSTATKNSPASAAEREIKRYLELRNIPRKECPLKYWRQNSVDFPILSQLASKYLLPPATCVPYDIFSKGAQQLLFRRTLLSHKNLKICMGLKME